MPTCRPSTCRWYFHLRPAIRHLTTQHYWRYLGVERPSSLQHNTQHSTRYRLNTGPYPSHNGKCIKCTDNDHGDSIQNRAAYRKVACLHVFQSGSPFNSKYPMFMLEGVSRLIWNCLTMRTVALLGGGKGVRGRQPPGLNSKWLIAALNWVPRSQPYFVNDIWYNIFDIWYLIFDNHIWVGSLGPNSEQLSATCVWPWGVGMSRCLPGTLTSCAYTQSTSIGSFWNLTNY